MSENQLVAGRPERLRERKRRQTHQRIAEVALRLFLEKGFDETTLDEIASAADISRRTASITLTPRTPSCLRARKQANYKYQEETLFAALVQKWPATEKRVRLRAVAMMGIGAMRIAAEAWSAENGARPLEAHVQEAFAALTDGTP